MNFSNPFLNQQAMCSCGRTHEIPIKTILVEESIEQSLVNEWKQSGATGVLVVADANTYEVMGQKVVSWAQGAGFPCARLVFEDAAHLLPDEEAIQQVRRMISETGYTGIVAVGSGVINDIVRYASYEEKKPYIVVATAPSMDGYASSIAALQFQGLKTTLPAQAPRAIFAEVDILANAPFELVQSGFGDLIGKVISLMDWKLSRALYDEYFCEASYEMVRQPLEYCVTHAEEIRQGDKEATSQLFAGLINAGLAMAMMGNSRPCSGSEHHCSHYWDLLAFKERREHHSHGLQVGYSTSWMIQFYRTLAELKSIEAPMIPSLSEAYQQEIVRLYGADGAKPIFDVIRAKQAFQSGANRYGEWTVEALIASLDPEWSMLSSVEHALGQMDITNQMTFLELDKDMLKETFLHANELRERFTIFDFLKSQERLEATVEEVLAQTPRI